MTLKFKEWAELVSKYTFIDKAETKGPYFYLHYTKYGKQKHKKLPLRASGNQLQMMVKSIRKELGVSVYGRGKETYVF